MHRYNINRTKLVIIPLDGTVFDLNRYRYNYYHHLCDNKHIPLQKKEFYDCLSNMYDMYKTLPLAKKVDVGPLNAKIERELLQYLANKGIKPKDGFLELIEYLHQKNIQIAILSTHRTKDAVQYLQQAKIYNKVQFIIGSDTNSLPLPSTQILETIMDYFKANNEETLVISSFMSLNHAARQLHLNVIFCEDLVKADLDEKETSYKTVNNLFEILNIFLFDKYEDVEIYSPILGMNDQMDKEQLDNIHNQLTQTYKEDSQVLDLVNQTYEFHLSQLNTEEKQPTLHKQHFSFEHEDTSHKEDIQDLFKEEPQEINADQLIEDVRKEKEETEVSQAHLNPLSNKDDEELTTLLQHINKKKEPQETTIKTITDYDEIKQIVTEATEDNTKKPSLLLSFIVNILYIFAISFLILFIGIIIYIAFIHQFEVNKGIFSIITSIFHTYYSLVEGTFSLILNGLHSLIHAIPDYQSYVASNPFFSNEGVKLLNMFLFQSIIIGIIKTTIHFIRKDSDNEDDSYED